MFLASARSSILPLMAPLARRLRRIDRRMAAWVRAAGPVWGVTVLMWAVTLYFLVNFILPGALPADSYLYTAQPVLWSSLALLAALGWRYGLNRRPVATAPLLVTALLLALSQIAAGAISGLLFGFGRSPYSQQLDGMLRNLLYLGTLLAGMEMLRAYLIVRLRRAHPWIVFILVFVLLTILRVAPNAFWKLSSLQSGFQFLGERLLPLLAQNMLATLLALLGGPLASLTYLGGLSLFEWLSPMLPNPGWFINAVVGTLLPGLGMVIVYNQFIATPESGATARSHPLGDFASWAAVGVTGLLLVGFSSGLFGLHPSLIGSSSMAPNIQVGDIVVVNKVPVETIRTGDVISFRQDGIPIVHRVREVYNEHGQVLFITQGDANNAADPPVLAQNYTGKVIFTIPKIGWISIFMRNALVRIF